MDKKTQWFPLALGTVIVMSVIASCAYADFTKDQKEGFTNANQPSKPIFLNLYPPDRATDFELFDIIQRFKYQIDSPNSNHLPPLLFVPGLGSCPIFARWRKPLTKNVKQLVNNSFQVDTKWNCRQVQSHWTELWFPRKYLDSKLSMGCWMSNFEVHYNHEANDIENTHGVETEASPEIETYMLGMTDSLKSLGYEFGKTLFIEPYDFRKVCAHKVIQDFCERLKQRIEISVKSTKRRMVLVGHDIGSVLINYFLVKMPREWKRNYVSCFVTFGGNFGGCPQALRTFISGLRGTGMDVSNELLRKCAGVQLMLPNPVIWKDQTIIELDGVKYSSNDITKIMQKLGSTEASQIYNNIVLDFQKESMKAPDVDVYCFNGRDVDTEMEYRYSSGDTQPKILKSDTGDGIMPGISLDIPMKWSSFQSNPIFYHHYKGVQHRDLLGNRFSIKDLLSVVTQSN